MKPDLVLNEDEKKKRFKKKYSNFNKEGNKNKRQKGEMVDQITLKKKEDSTSHEKGSSPLEFPLPPFQSDLNDEDDESRKEDFLEFVKETAGAMNVQKIFSDLAENESGLDPETGMLVNKGKLYNFLCIRGKIMSLAINLLCLLPLRSKKLCVQLICKLVLCAAVL